MNFTDFDDEDGDLGEAVFDMEKIKNNLPIYNNKKLCEMIVCNRYFNFNQELTVLCMTELSNRRIAGDDFEYEKYIEDSFKELPTLAIELPNIKDMLNQFVKK